MLCWCLRCILLLHPLSIPPAPPPPRKAFHNRKSMSFCGRLLLKSPACWSMNSVLLSPQTQQSSLQKIYSHLEDHVIHPKSNLVLAAEIQSLYMFETKHYRFKWEIQYTLSYTTFRPRTQRHIPKRSFWINLHAVRFVRANNRTGNERRKRKRPKKSMVRL